MSRGIRRKGPKPAQSKSKLEEAGERAVHRTAITDTRKMKRNIHSQVKGAAREQKDQSMPLARDGTIIAEGELEHI